MLFVGTLTDEILTTILPEDIPVIENLDISQTQLTAAMAQQDVLELARQGNPNAISTLMNRSLQPKGITVKASMKNCCLQVMLESAQVPDAQILTSFVRKGMMSLGTASIKRVKMYGRKTGDDFPSWSQEFELSE